MAAKLAGKHAEQAELAGRVAECQAKLEAKLQELRAVADAKQQVTPSLVLHTDLCIALCNNLVWCLC